MTLAKLKKMLEDKVIDQKEFDSMVEKLGLKEDDKKDDGKKDDKGGLPENLQDIIQKAVDRATNKLGNENKSLREELEKMKKAKMDDDQLKEYELNEKIKALEEKEKEIKDKELRMFAIKAVKDAGLDDGSDTALALVDLLMADSEENITAKTSSLKTLVEKSVQSQVKQRFKDSGRDMSKGGGKDEDDDEGDKADNVAVKLAKSTAENNKATQSILNHYTGGNE